MAHQIRLKHPWTSERVVEAGGNAAVLYSRQFNRPTGLTSGQLVQISVGVCEQDFSRLAIRLNDSMVDVGTEASDASSPFSKLYKSQCVNAELRAFNRLELVIPACDAISSDQTIRSLDELVSVSLELAD